MSEFSTVALLALVAGFVLFAARWRAKPTPLRILPPGMNEIPIATADGALLTRASGDREAAMRAALLTSDRLSRREWKAAMDDILLVHDDLTGPELQALLARISAGLGPSNEARPRERFLIALEQAGRADAVESLGTFFAPGPFDAYRLNETAGKKGRRG